MLPISLESNLIVLSGRTIDDRDGGELHPAMLMAGVHKKCPA